MKAWTKLLGSLFQPWHNTSTYSFVPWMFTICSSGSRGSTHPFTMEALIPPSTERGGSWCSQWNPSFETAFSWDTHFAQLTPIPSEQLTLMAGQWISYIHPFASKWDNSEKLSIPEFPMWRSEAFWTTITIQLPFQLSPAFLARSQYWSLSRPRPTHRFPSQSLFLVEFIWSLLPSAWHREDNDSGETEQVQR